MTSDIKIKENNDLIGNLDLASATQFGIIISFVNPDVHFE